MSKAGKEFEEVTAAIKRALAGPDVTVTPNGKAWDKVAGEFREFDVLITGKVAGTPIVIGVECRDRKRPLDVGQVEAYSRKLHDCGINRGLMVSRNGFTQGARSKAAHHNILCCRLDEVRSLPWMVLFDLQVLRTATASDYQVQFSFSGPRGGAPVAFHLDGSPESPLTMAEFVQHILDSREPESLADGPGRYRARVEYVPRGLVQAEFEAPRTLTALRRAVVEWDYDVIESRPVVKQWQFGRADGEPHLEITRAVVAEIEGVPIELETILHRSGEEG